MLERRGFVALLFLLSGAAALIYQMAWQRLLFAIFGVDTDSVAVIVSVFMLGLGLGVLFSFAPARAAARISPAEALRNE